MNAYIFQHEELALLNSGIYELSEREARQPFILASFVREVLNLFVHATI
jgi:hypothetical protein